MFFLGIDIGKRHHEACIIDSKGAIQCKTLRFPNTHLGGQTLVR